MVIKVLFYNCDCMSPFASLTSIPWMFNSFKEGVLDKNPLTKFFDLLNNYLVLFVISFVMLLLILLPVLIAVLDIILLYKTVFKKDIPKELTICSYFFKCSIVVLVIVLDIVLVIVLNIILVIILVVVCFNKTRIILLNV